MTGKKKQKCLVHVLFSGLNKRRNFCYNPISFPRFVNLHLGPLLSTHHGLPAQTLTLTIFTTQLHSDKNKVLNIFKQYNNHI